MSKEIQDQTFVISVRSFVAIGAASLLLVGEYLVLQNDINEAKSLPKTEVSKIEFDFTNKKLQYQIDALKEELESLKK